MPVPREVFAVRFGRHRLPRSAFYLNYAGYGESDGVVGMDYYLWVVRSQDGWVVVDTGFAPAQPTEAPELAHMVRVRDEGRLTLVGQGHQLAPGVDLIEVGGHTTGQLIVLVRGAGASTVLASDAIHSYEEFERDRPFGILADVVDTYRAFDQIRDIAREPGMSVVAGHDPEVMTRFTPWEGGRAGTICRIL